MVATELYIQIAQKIIKEQETIIGPIALEQAMKVQGLDIGNSNNIQIQGDAKKVLSDLVDQYVKLFGRASIEVCKEAIQEIKPAVAIDQLPDILR
jgi:hypothetical protein